MDEKKRARMGKMATAITLLVNICLMASKAIVGILFHSTAITADAFNNGGDIFTSAAVFSGIRIAHLPPDETHHYGHVKAEPIVAKIVSLIIMGTGFGMGYSAVLQIINKRLETPGFPAVIVALLSIIVKYFLYRYTNRVGNMIGSPSMVADSYNHKSDVLASFSALVGISGARLGYSILDPIGGLIVSLIIFKTGISIYIESVSALMDSAPDIDTLNLIKDEACNTQGVLQVNEIKARKNGPNILVDLKICVNKNITVQEGHEIAARTKFNIKKRVDNVDDIMIHIDPCSPEKKESKYCNDCCVKKNNTS